MIKIFNSQQIFLQSDDLNLNIRNKMLCYVKCPMGWYEIIWCFLVWFKHIPGKENAQQRHFYKHMAKPDVRCIVTV